MGIKSFQSQLNTEHTSEGNQLLDDIPTILRGEQKISLSKFPSIEVVYDIISGMSPDNAPGPDGFNGFSYFYCWDIINKTYLKLF